MLRKLVLEFSRNLKISQYSRINTDLNRKLLFSSTNPSFIRTDNFKTQTIREVNYSFENSEPQSSSVTNSFIETDADYVLKYEERYKSPRKQLESNFRIRPVIIDEMFEKDPKLNNINPFELSKVINILLENCVSKTNVIENTFILKMNADLLKRKIDLLNQLKLKNINDGIPLLQISEPRLRKIAAITKKEANILHPFENRLYYLSEKLQVEPKLISSYIGKRYFMFQIPFSNMTEILNCLLEFGVGPINILKDLWAFRYTPDSVRSRLERASVVKKDKIMPWMVRCPEKVLQRSLKLAYYEKKFLGEKKSIIDYISKRLNYDADMTKAIMAKHPAVFRVRIKKIKEIFDYLLNDARFSPAQIAACPRIFCHKLETTKSRLEELKSYGCIPTSLVIVCRSKREYQKFLTNWCSFKNKIRIKQINNK